MYQNQLKFSGNLHALRGLAAFSVIFYHAKGMNPPIDPGALGMVSQFGAGVALFFILSGFSLCLSNYHHIDKPDWLRAYSIKRIARIIPVWYAFIAITWLYHFYKFNGYMVSNDSVLFSLIPFYSIVPGKSQGLVWAGWTVGIELMFYMIFPLLLVLFRNNVKAWTLALIGLIVISVRVRGYAGADAASLYIDLSFPRQAFIFIMGCAFYFMTKRMEEYGRVREFSILMLLLSIAGFALWIANTKRIIAIPYDYILVVQAFALGGLTVFAFVNPKFGKLPQFNLYNPVTKFLGNKSYTIYLAHPIVVTQTKPYYETINGLVPNLTAAFLLYCALVIAVTCVIATVISTLIEEPLYKRGRAFATKVMDKKTAALNTPPTPDKAPAE